MKTISVSELIKNKPNITSGDISFVYLKETDNLYKSRFYNNFYTVSFVLDGRKEIFGSDGITVVTYGQGLLMPAGNAIISEHRLDGESYSRILVLFPREVLVDFLVRHELNLKKRRKLQIHSYVHFINNAYLNQYAQQIKSFIGDGVKLSHQIAMHKLEELLMILSERYSDEIANLLDNNSENYLLQLKHAVENNLLNNLSLDELAFLTNRSLSTFKRDFEKAFQVAPQKYIRTRKLEIAADELTKGIQPNGLYEMLGYENVSNFNAAFKKHFGITPAAYQAKFKM